MKRILKHIDDKISDIRASDETTKTIWLYTLTTAISLAVIGLWIGYEQFALPIVAAPIGVPQLAAATTPSQAPGVTETFRVGANAVANSLSARFTRGLALLKTTFLGDGNTMNISGADRNFIPENLPSLEKGQLPR